MVFNITKFSEFLLENLENLNEWPKKVKTMQKNWIGKSFGCEINFKIEGSNNIENIACYTTRPDTLIWNVFSCFICRSSFGQTLRKR